MDTITSIYDKFQTVIPADIRKKFDLDKSYKIKWKINEKGNVELEFFKELHLEDMIGKYTSKENIDCVKLSMISKIMNVRINLYS